MKKLVIVINGKGGSGKDTLCESLKSKFKVRNISAITPIVNIATANGWNGTKDEKSRKFLADLKQLFIHFNDLPCQYLLEEYSNFCDSMDQILTVHIREPDEIEKFVQKISTPCISILVKRGEDKRYGNDADDGVDNYSYTHIFYNDGTIEESTKQFISLVQQYF